MSDLRVSQRPVVAERLQSAGTDAQLLADILIVHPAAELPFLSLADDFIHPVGQLVELTDHFLILFFRDNYYIHCVLYIVFVVNNPFRLQSKTSVSIKQWFCDGLAACGSKWQRVALSADL